MNRHVYNIVNSILLNAVFGNENLEKLAMGQEVRKILGRHIALASEEWAWQARPLNPCLPLSTSLISEASHNWEQDQLIS